MANIIICSKNQPDRKAENDTLSDWLIGKEGAEHNKSSKIINLPFISGCDHWRIQRIINCIQFFFQYFFLITTLNAQGRIEIFTHHSTHRIVKKNSFFTFRFWFCCTITLTEHRHAHVKRPNATDWLSDSKWMSELNWMSLPIRFALLRVLVLFYNLHP